jgi:hypothetical protein
MVYKLGDVGARTHIFLHTRTMWINTNFNPPINPLPPEPLPTWGPEAFFGILEGFRRNFTTVFWVVLCPKHLLFIEGNYETFQKNSFYMTL